MPVVRRTIMTVKPIDYECGECGEPQSAHSDTHDSAIIDHEYILGCYCAESGRCEVCVDAAIDYAEYLRDAAKEGG